MKVLLQLIQPTLVYALVCSIVFETRNICKAFIYRYVEKHTHKPEYISA